MRSSYALRRCAEERAQSTKGKLDLPRAIEIAKSLRARAIR
jgi:hypothetical protein